MIELFAELVLLHYILVVLQLKCIAYFISVQVELVNKIMNHFLDVS